VNEGPEKHTQKEESEQFKNPDEREKNEMYRAIVDNLETEVWVVNSEGDMRYANPAGRKHFKERDNDYENHSIYEVMDFALAERMMVLVRKTIKQETEKPFGLEIEIDDGTTHRYKVNTRVFLDYEGNGKAVMISAFDITDTKTAEAKVLQSEQNYRTLFQNSPDGYLLLDEGKFIMCNKATEELFRKDRAYIIGKSPGQLSPAYQKNGKSSQECAEEMIHITKERKKHAFEWVHQRFDGSVFTAKVSTSSVIYNEKPVIFVSLKDITEEKQTEAMVRKLSQVIEQSALSIFILDDKGFIEYANPSAYLSIGISEEEIKNMGNEETSYKKQYFRELEDFLREVRNRKEKTETVYKTRKMDELRWESLTVSPIFDSVGTLTHYVVFIKDISDRKSVEEELKVSETRYRQVAEHSRTVVWETDTEGLFTYISPVTETVLGYRAEELIDKKHFFDLFPEESREMQKSTGITFMQEQRTLTNYENRAVRKDGKTIWLSSNAVPAYDEKGVYSGYRGTENEITARKIAEEELKKFRTVADQANYGIAISETNGKLIYVNQEFAKMHGWTVNTLIGKNITGLLAEDQIGRLSVLLQQIHIDDGFVAEKMWHIRKDETVFPTLMSAKNIIDEQGKPVFISITVIDITDRIEAENRLTLLSHTTEQNPASIIITNAHGEIEYINRSFTEKTGYSLEELKGKNPRVIKSGIHTREFYENLWHTILFGNKWHGEICNKKKNGELFWESSLISPVLNENKEITHFVAVKEDITEKKEAEEALKESEMKMRSISESAQEAIIMVDKEGIITFWNPSAERIFGYSPKETIGKKYFFSLLPSCDREKHRVAFFEFQKKEPPRAEEKTLELECLRKNGETLMMELSLSSVRYQNTWQAIGILRDISERDEAEKERIARKAAEEANKAKSLFLSNMSHEIRTPLNAIIGFTQILQKDPLLSVKQAEQIRTIARSGEHLLKLINDILDLSRIEAGRTEVRLTVFGFSNLVNDLQNMFRFKAEEKGLRFVMEKAESVPEAVSADEAKLRQILINLLGNAVKFTQKGSITIRIKVEQLCDENIKDRYDCFLDFEVEDTGSGISDEELPFLFESFRTLKAGQRYGGSGLGLAISRHLAEMMEGTLSVTSKEGTGSVFKLRIPAKIFEQEIKTAVTKHRQVIGIEKENGPFRVLVVDDHEDNREMLFLFLSQVGFLVKRATNGLEALTLFEDWEPQVILMDMRMPVLDGYEATKRIKATEKGRKIPIIAVTASVFEDNEKEVWATGVDGFLRKPFRQAELFEVIERVLPVKYIFEEEKDINDRNTGLTITREDIGKLPPELIQEMLRAVEQGEMVRLRELIKKVELIDNSIANGLHTLAKHYDYQKLTDLLKSN
jgi:PAS domain S-box-containing protein